MSETDEGATTVGYSCWQCGYVTYSDKGYEVISLKACPMCGAKSSFELLSGQAQQEDDAKTAMAESDKET